MNKVLGIGNALVDVMILLDDDKVLDELNFPKGSMQLVDENVSNDLIIKFSHKISSRSSGGSAANTIQGLASLGIETGYIGKVGHDELGYYFQKELEERNIKPMIYKSETETGRVVALVSPDSERTFATYLGAAIELEPNELHSGLFAGYSILHIEGYLVQNHDLMYKAANLAKEREMKISLDLSSFNIVAAEIDFLKPFIEKYVDIVFANEEEAKAFTGKDPHKALNELSKLCEIAVVKVGKKGSLVASDKTSIIIGPVVSKVIDTTGAGDYYASGFLYGLIKNLPLYKCGEIGSLLAGRVIEEIGAKISDERWPSIIETVKRIELIGTNKWSGLKA
jgi:sugar/nucleoside kinase (ribokinase family)